MTIIWLFVTVTAGLRPNANISKSIHWQFNYTASTEKEKRNIRFPFRSAFDWTANRRVFGGALARNMWEQLAGNVTEQNIGRIHFGGACQLPVNVNVNVKLKMSNRMPSLGLWYNYSGGLFAYFQPLNVQQMQPDCSWRVLPSCTGDIIWRRTADRWADCGPAVSSSCPYTPRSQLRREFGPIFTVAVWVSGLNK